MNNGFYLQSEALAPEPYHYTVCGLDNVLLMNGFTIHEYEGEIGVAVHDVEGLHKAIARHVVLHRKALEPKEMLFLRRTLDLTQAELGAKMGCNAQTVARWEKGNCAMPGSADRLLRILVLVKTQHADDQMDHLVQLISEAIDELVEQDQIETPQARFSFDNSHWEERELEAAA